MLQKQLFESNIGTTTSCINIDSSKVVKPEKIAF